MDLAAETEALACLPLFLSLRAAVRAHVSAAASCQGIGTHKLRHEAHRYLDAALAYLSPEPPRMVAIGGLSGSGKSRLARKLAPLMGPAPGALVVRSDVIRKRLADAGLHDRLGESGYTGEMTRRTYETLYATAQAALSAGHSVIADAVFAKSEQRNKISDAAEIQKTSFDGLWLNAPPEILLKRVVGRKRNVSDATVNLVRQQLDYDIGPWIGTYLMFRSRRKKLSRTPSACWSSKIEYLEAVALKLGNLQTP